MIEQYSCYEFEIQERIAPLHIQSNKDHPLGYVYVIYSEGSPPLDDGKIESQEYFDTPQEARFAAIGHISLLEMENYND